MTILNIETATKMCSVALGKDGEIISFKEKGEIYSHAENLTLFIEEVLNKAGIALKEIDAVAVSKGPGSYTGLRIGVSTAKGICYGLDKPLIAVESLKAMAWGLKEKAKTLNALLCPMIDARRMEVYTAVYDPYLSIIRPVDAQIIDGSAFHDLLKEHEILFFGDGADKCKAVLGNNKHALFIDNYQSSANYMSSLSEEAFRNKRFESLAYFEPYYLKEFVATKPKQR